MSHSNKGECHNILGIHRTAIKYRHCGTITRLTTTFTAALLIVLNAFQIIHQVTAMLNNVCINPTLFEIEFYLILEGLALEAAL